VDRLVIYLVRPGAEQLLQLGHRLQRRARLPAGGGDLDQELRPHCLEQAFDFAFPLGAAGPRVGDLDAEHGQRVQQLPGHVRAAVIEVMKSSS
jgi:hypothetical protein